MRPYEFWHPRVFEAPYYLFLLALCLRHRLPPKQLAKANYGLDHGELGLGSKFTTQMAFDQEYFLPTVLLSKNCTREQAVQLVSDFSSTHNWPLILKPDIGAVGKGLLKLGDEEDINTALDAIYVDEVILGEYLLQAYTPFTQEYGVFVVRKDGRCHISGINKKHFPTVVGNGVDTIEVLARRHERYTEHWQLFLKYLDTTHIPELNESRQLSFIGSHTMGCKFTNDCHLLTEELTQTFTKICDSQPGFNFGRLDVKAQNLEAFQAGEFVVIEVNGIASLPTHMFDPDNSLLEAYRIFMQHGRLLASIAAEQRNQSMQLDSYSAIWQRAKTNHRRLNEMHESALS